MDVPADGDWGTNRLDVGFFGQQIANNLTQFLNNCKRTVSIPRTNLIILVMDLAFKSFSGKYLHCLAISNQFSHSGISTRQRIPEPQVYI